MKKILKNLKFEIEKLKKRLNHRVEKTSTYSLISFSSNDYLNLSTHKKTKRAGLLALKKYGTGGASSKFIQGYHFLYREIEEEMKKHKSAEDCLIFNSGYLANLGIFSSLFGKNDIIFLDENCHASSFEGAKLSGAKIIRFKANSISDLEEKLAKYKADGIICIATETVFSMQGTKLANYEKYFEVAARHEAILITDEAHSFGLFDDEFCFPKYDLHLQMGTFSKAVGALGGYVLGSEILIDYIRQFAKGGIYTTALPPACLASILEAIKLIFSREKTGKKALQNAQYFAKLLNINAESQIVFFGTETNEKALKMVEVMEGEGFLVRAIRRPTVKSPGIRFSFSNADKKLDIKKLAFILLSNYNNL